MSELRPWPLRLLPGADLRGALEAEVAARGEVAAFVVAGIGSLSGARIRLAGAEDPVTIEGDSEILMLSGTVGHGRSHLHISVADATGHVKGGHVAPGCRVRTTAEVLLVLLPGWDFSRASDAATGYEELRIRPR